MTKAEAVEKYREAFGVFPSFLFMGAKDPVIVAAVEKALKSGQPILPEPGRVF